VQDGEDDFRGRPPLFLHDPHRDAATVVGDGDAVVRVQDDPDLVAVARERLVHRVVDDLVHKVVQAARPGRADVHAGSFADRFEPLQNGDVGGAVGGVGVGFFRRQRGPSD
jgi:hypothetical protein